MPETHPPTAAAEAPAYFRWIDGLRGVAALMVVIFHYHHFYLADYGARPDLPDSATFPYARILQPVFDHGYWAVQLFWIISGFVFAHVYLSRPTSLRQFTVARIARLYPLHVVTLIYVAILQATSLAAAGHWQIYGNNDLRHFLLQLVMASNLTTQSHGLSFNGPIWSVSLELAAYTAFFVLLSVIRRFPLMVPLACCAIGFGIAASGLDLPLLRLAVFTCIGYFFVGTALYGLCWRLRWKVPRLLMLGIATAGIAGLGWDMLDSLSRAVLISVALIALLVVCDLTLPKAGQRLRPLGDLSYAIYLVHVPLQITWLLAVDLIRGNTRTFADSPWVLPVYMALAILLAVIAHRKIETPAGAWMRARLSTPTAPSAEIAPGSPHFR